MKIYNIVSDYQIINERLSSQSVIFDNKLFYSIVKIFNDVERVGDKEILRLTECFHGISKEVTSIEYSRIDVNLSEELTQSFDFSLNQIIAFNKSSLKKDWFVKGENGISFGERVTPLESVCLYVPASKGPLVSTALMLIGAAKAAGVKNIYVAMPPVSENNEPDKITAEICFRAGVDRIFVGNGVGLIAGFSHGTKQIPKVSGIFGPGPGAIAAAMLLSMRNGVKSSIGYGPTESAIVTDGQGLTVEQTARNSVNEAEHGKDSCSIIISTDYDFLTKVSLRISDLLKNDCPRTDILRHSFSLDGCSTLIYSESLERAVDLINEFAPEHLIFDVKSSDKKYMERIKNAGEIITGDGASFSAANYCIGVTAVLPTNRYAKSFSGLTSNDMVKISTIGDITGSAAKDISKYVEEFSNVEGLFWHGVAGNLRKKV